MAEHTDSREALVDWLHEYLLAADADPADPNTAHVNVAELICDFEMRVAAPAATEHDEGFECYRCNGRWKFVCLCHLKDECIYGYPPAPCPVCNPKGWAP